MKLKQELLKSFNSDKMNYLFLLTLIISPYQLWSSGNYIASILTVALYSVSIFRNMTDYFKNELIKAQQDYIKILEEQS